MKSRRGGFSAIILDRRGKASRRATMLENMLNLPFRRNAVAPRRHGHRDDRPDGRDHDDRAAADHSGRHPHHPQHFDRAADSAGRFLHHRADAILFAAGGHSHCDAVPARDHHHHDAAHSAAGRRRTGGRARSAISSSAAMSRSGWSIFFIITIAQFVVITKGGERVAEVAARFSLDALPGKQMSIDNELRNGDITQPEARALRRALERESHLYGAMDGAMKFVKGDAIAGLVIIVVNLIGGLAVGMAQQGLTFGQAVQTFSLLTVGDGLVAQIPALLISRRRRYGGDARRDGGKARSRLRHHRPTRQRCTRALSGARHSRRALAFIPGFPLYIFLDARRGAHRRWRSRSAPEGGARRRRDHGGRQSCPAGGDSVPKPVQGPRCRRRAGGPKAAARPCA